MGCCKLLKKLLFLGSYPKFIVQFCKNSDNGVLGNGGLGFCTGCLWCVKAGCKK